METRKRWRNRDVSAGEGVLALLEALREGIGAQAVGLFDDDRAEIDAAETHATAALDFWDSFGERPCSMFDWDAWYRKLRRDDHVSTICHCPARHQLSGYLIHKRWALLLVVPPSLPETGASTVASTIKGLADRLPPAKTAAEREAIRRHDGTPPPDRSAGSAPSWWVRKPS